MKRPPSRGRYKLIPAFSFSFILLIAISVVPSYAQSNSGGNISNTETAMSFQPEVTAFRNNVYVVWEESMEEGGGEPDETDIFFTRSTDLGKTFSEPVNLSNSAGISSDCALAVSESHVYVVWQDIVSGDSEIFFAKSTDSGTSFSEPISFNDDGFDPKIATTTNGIIVVWEQDSEILAKVSNDGDNTFGEAINISNTLTSSSDPSVASEGDDVSIMWIEGSDGTIVLRSSTDGGNSFDGTVKLRESNGKARGPTIATSGDSTFVLWREDTTLDDTVLLWSRNVTGFQNPDAIVQGDVFLEYDLAAFGTGVYIAFEEGEEIMLVKSTDSGATLSSPIRINDERTFSRSPSIAASGNNVYLAWVDHTAIDEIFFASSTDGGLTFSPAATEDNVQDEDETGQQDTEEETPDTEQQEPSTEKSDFVTVQHEDRIFTVPAYVTNGNLTSIEVVPGDGVLVNIKMEAGGLLTITLPRELIDAKESDGTDKDFFIRRGGQFLEFTEVNSTDTERTLQIGLSASGGPVQIEGTHVIPEFPIPLLFMAALIGLVVILAKRPNFLSGRYFC